jgi:hypothetical protein
MQDPYLSNFNGSCRVGRIGRDLETPGGNVTVPTVILSLYLSLDMENISIILILVLLSQMQLLMQL